MKVKIDSEGLKTILKILDSIDKVLVKKVK
jgi:hypothetical protein